MNNNTPIQSPFRVGFTTVEVHRTVVDERNGRVLDDIIIHKGVIVQETSSFVRVFNNAPRDKGGDPNPEIAELFPVASSRVWVRQTGELKFQFPVPAIFR